MNFCTREAWKCPGSRVMNFTLPLPPAPEAAAEPIAAQAIVAETDPLFHDLSLLCGMASAP